MSNQVSEKAIKLRQLAELKQTRGQHYAALDKVRRGEPFPVSEGNDRAERYAVFYPGSERYGYGASEFHRTIECIETSDIRGSVERLDSGVVYVNGKRKLACNIFNNKTHTWVRLNYRQLVSDQEKCWIVFGVDGAVKHRPRQNEVLPFSNRVDRSNARFSEIVKCLDPQ